MEVIKETIGDDLFGLNNEYIINYYSFLEKPSYRLRSIRNVDGSFSVYDDERGTLINAIRKSGKAKFIVLPISLCAILSQKIRYNFFENERHEMYLSSVYNQLDIANEGPDNDKLDDYLCYFGSMVIDA